MRGRPWILPPDALVIQSGSPLEASAGHGLERRQGPRKRYGAGSEVRTAAGCRLRLSAAATTQAPKRPRSPEAIRSHSSDRNEYFISTQIYAQTGILTHNFLDLAGEHCSDRKSDRFGRGCQHAGRLAARIGSGSAGFLSCQLVGSVSMGGCRRRAVLPGLLRTGVAAGVCSAACAAAQAPAYGDSMTFGVSGRDGLALEFYVGVT